jgi:hypothetical protein
MSPNVECKYIIVPSIPKGRTVAEYVQSLSNLEDQKIVAIKKMIADALEYQKIGSEISLPIEHQSDRQVSSGTIDFEEPSC